MSQQDGQSEAIAVVIEKLTELIEDIDRGGTGGTAATDPDPSAGQEHPQTTQVLLSFPIRLGDILVRSPEQLVATLRRWNDKVAVSASTTNGSEECRLFCHRQRSPSIDDGVYRCRGCGFRASIEATMRRHLSAVHRDNGTTYEVFSPQGSRLVTVPASCDETANLLNEPACSATYVCERCDFSAGDMKALTRHMDSHKEDHRRKAVRREQQPEGQASYCCSLCGYTCRQQRTIKAHVWKHSGNQNIAYPMFQNGPLSVYDSEELARELPPANIVVSTDSRNNVAPCDNQPGRIDANLRDLPSKSADSSKIEMIVRTVVVAPDDLIDRDTYDVTASADSETHCLSTAIKSSKTMNCSPPEATEALVTSTEEVVVTLTEGDDVTSCVMITTDDCPPLLPAESQEGVKRKRAPDDVGGKLAKVLCKRETIEGTATMEGSESNTGRAPDDKAAMVNASRALEMAAATLLSLSPRRAEKDDVVLQKEGGICRSLLAVIEQLCGGRDDETTPRDTAQAVSCQLCCAAFACRSELRAHVRVHCEEAYRQLITSSAPQTAPLACSQCEFIATSVRSLKSHGKRHSNARHADLKETHTCELCGYVCHHRAALKSHMWRHAADSSYSYEQTNRNIDAVSDTDKPAPQPPPNKIVCYLCGYTCRHSAALKSHMWRHASDEGYSYDAEPRLSRCIDQANTLECVGEVTVTTTDD